MGKEFWIDTKLSSLFLYVRGISYKKGDETHISKSGYIKLLRANNIDANGVNDNDVLFLPEYYIKAHQILQNSDIVIAMSSGSINIVGKTAQIKNHIPKTTVGAFCGILRPIKSINPKYLGYFFTTTEYRNSISNQARGTNINNIKQEYFDNILIPLPPLDEQQRIVEKLDAILPRIKEVKNRLEKIPVILKRFRQSVLAAACSGRLTEGWRFDSAQRPIMSERVTPSKNKIRVPASDEYLEFEIPEGWKKVYIKDIAINMATGPFGSMLHSHEYTENGTPVINPTNIIENCIHPYKKVTINDNKVQELSKYKLKENDILLARRGDLSKCAIVTKSEEGWIAGTGLFILKAIIDPIFFRYNFQMEYIQNKLSNSAIGSTMVNLNQNILGNLVIVYPPLHEQKEIVRQVEKLFSWADSIEARYETAMQRINKIEQSVLAKAFLGELAEQNPDDEPAEVLLDRIRGEKQRVKTQ